ncbi:glycerophosphodiester phosphodiesterase GDPD1, chloroplastic-like [Actinidia eriantha]|uniref:glycerophosphodiester phosphodiesterase GDPD1, chloroplastic-like n=1 Tax=Actinidia eriantha TaxID=165200 RepID=UPI00259074D5|nr:glycerophosphodiester phosphodiesterase GDPD1, chloroplastic-like [Actinidia eriantha]
MRRKVGVLIMWMFDLSQAFFLTNGGTEIYYDVRRNSLEEAVKLCLECGLQGIVSEIKGIFRNPGVVTKIKEAKLSLLTYGQLNNVPEAVYMQHLMGVEGEIVDLVQEITESVSYMIKPSMEEGEEEILLEGEGQIQVKTKPQFSERELSFLLKLIPKLIQLQEHIYTPNLYRLRNFSIVVVNDFLLVHKWFFFLLFIHLHCSRNDNSS